MRVESTEQEYTTSHGTSHAGKCYLGISHERSGTGIRDRSRGGVSL